MYINRNNQVPKNDGFSYRSIIKPHYYTPPPPPPPISLPKIHKQRRARRPRSASGFYVPVCRRTNFILSVLHDGKSRTEIQPGPSSLNIPNSRPSLSIRNPSFFQTRHGRDLLDGNCPVVATTSSLRKTFKGNRSVKDVLRNTSGRDEITRLMTDKKVFRKDGTNPIGRHFTMKRMKRRKKKKNKRKKKKKRIKRRKIEVNNRNSHNSSSSSIYFSKMDNLRDEDRYSSVDLGNTVLTNRRLIRNGRRKNQQKLERIKSVERVILNLHKQSKIYY